MPSISQVEHNMTDAKLDLTLPLVVAQIQHHHERQLEAEQAKAGAGVEGVVVAPRVITSEQVELLASQVRSWRERERERENARVLRTSTTPSHTHTPARSLPRVYLLSRNTHSSDARQTLLRPSFGTTSSRRSPSTSHHSLQLRGGSQCACAVDRDKATYAAHS